MKQSQKEKSMKQEQFISVAVDTVISTLNDKSMRSLQNIIDRLKKEYTNKEGLKLPCRDTMYKYLSNCITEFERENDVEGLNHFGIFKRYSICANALKGLSEICDFSYKTVAEDANGFYVGLLCVDQKKEKSVADYIATHFSYFIMSVFPGLGGIIIFFKSANREAEFYNLLTPYNSDKFV